MQQIIDKTIAAEKKIKENTALIEYMSKEIKAIMAKIEDMEKFAPKRKKVQDQEIFKEDLIKK